MIRKKMDRSCVVPKLISLILSLLIYIIMLLQRETLMFLALVWLWPGILIVKEELPSKPLLNKCHVDKNKTLIENKTLTLVKWLKVHVITHHLVMKTFAKNEILMFLFLKSDWLDTQKQQTDRQSLWFQITASSLTSRAILNVVRCLLY